MEKEGRVLFINTYPAPTCTNRYHSKYPFNLDGFVLEVPSYLELEFALLFKEAKPMPEVVQNRNHGVSAIPDEFPHSRIVVVSIECQSVVVVVVVVVVHVHLCTGRWSLCGKLVITIISAPSSSRKDPPTCLLPTYQHFPLLRLSKCVFVLPLCLPFDRVAVLMMLFLSPPW